MNQEKVNSMFITLDGIDGVGKSTQMENLSQFLRSLGHEVLVVRDPGSSVVGAKLRQLLLESDLEMHRRTEAMLFMASRCEMIEKTIRPALTQGVTVLSERFLLANVVYQSIGGEVSSAELWELGLLANGNLKPDLTLLLDMPAESSIKRLEGPADRMESRGVDYLESVRQAFLRELPNSSPATAVIDAEQSPQQVTDQVLTQVQALIDAR